MEAVYDGRDFHLYLGGSREVSLLPTTQRTARLERLDGTDLGKRVELMFGEARNPDGIDLFFDDHAEVNYFPSCQGIRAVINQMAYENLRQLGQAVATYGKTENKVRVVRRG